MNSNNYLIIDNKEASNTICYVFCSSNGLFWGTRTKEYVFNNDWFEWENVANHKKIKSARKIIFLRDTSVSFYINGINKEINSIDKIIEFIERETKGLSIIAVGYSAGGYLANVLGLFLNNVEKVYGFGTIFNICEWDDFDNKYSCMKCGNHARVCRYFDLIPFFNEKDDSKKTIFYYIYGSNNNKDQLIAKKVKTKVKNDSIIFLPIASKTHGVKLKYHVVTGLLCSKKRLKSRKIPYSQTGFAIKINGLVKSLYYYLLDIKYKKRG